MPRPASLDDVVSRHVDLATIHTERVVEHPAMLKSLAAMIEATTRMGGLVERTYDTVKLRSPRSAAELETQLESEQRSWDRLQQMYDRAILRDDPGIVPLQEWEQGEVKEFAIAESLPDPFDVFAARDAELATKRRELSGERA